MNPGTAAVDEWLAAQSHLMTPGARAIRAAIHRAVPGAIESIKWQAPNFALDDDFATFNMRRPDVVQVILHTGAKPKPESSAKHIDGLADHLRWAGHNRAILTFTSADDVADSIPEFERMIALWALHH